MGMRAVELSSSGKEDGRSRAVVVALGAAVGLAVAVVVGLVVAVVVDVVVCTVLDFVVVMVVVGSVEQAARPMQQARTIRLQQNDMRVFLFIVTPHPG